MHVNLFTYRSIVPAHAADVFHWHEQPEALLELVPSSPLIRIERRSGGIRDGGTVTLAVGVGPFKMRWEARHFGYIRGEQFSDEQLRGPFSVWRHTHRVEPVGHDQTLYQDHIEYAVPGGRLVNWMAAPLVRRLLVRSFARRHAVVRAIFAGGVK